MQKNDMSKNITPTDSAVPIYLVPLSKEEEHERKLWVEKQLSSDPAVLAKKQICESTITKLIKLGLTEEEAKAIIGL